MKPWLLVLAACADTPVVRPSCTLPLAPGGDAAFVVSDRLAGTIASVSLEGAPALAPLLRGVIETHTGQSIGDAPLAADLRRLWASGVLSDARIDARQTADGIAVVFALTPEPRIASVHGADAPELRRLRWLEGTPYDPKRITRVVREIEEAYVRDGYVDATVAVHRSRGLDLCVSSVRGPHVTIRSLTFPGARAVPPGVLLELVSGKGVNHAGGTYDEEALAEDEVRLLNAYYDRGMIDAKLGSANVARSGDTLDIEVPVTEGPVYRLGTLRGLAVPQGLRTGAVFVRRALVDAIMQLEVQLDAAVTPLTQIDVQHRTVAVTFEILWRNPWSALRLLHWH